MADSLLRVAMAASSNGSRTRLFDSAVSGAITAATFTATPMNGTSYDPLTMGTVSASAKITVQVDGYYMVSMRTSYLGTVDGTRSIASIFVSRNGGSFGETIRGYDIASGGVQAMSLAAIGLIKMQAGDAVQGQIYTSTGASTTAAASALNTLEVAFLGPA